MKNDQTGAMRRFSLTLALGAMLLLPRYLQAAERIYTAYFSPAPGHRRSSGWPKRRVFSRSMDSTWRPC